MSQLWPRWWPRPRLPNFLITQRVVVPVEVLERGLGEAAHTSCWDFVWSWSHRQIDAWRSTARKDRERSEEDAPAEKKAEKRRTCPLGGCARRGRVPLEVLLGVIANGAAGKSCRRVDPISQGQRSAMNAARGRVRGTPLLMHLGGNLPPISTRAYGRFQSSPPNTGAAPRLFCFLPRYRPCPRPPRSPLRILVPPRLLFLPLLFVFLPLLVLLSSSSSLSSPSPSSSVPFLFSLVSSCSSSSSCSLSSSLLSSV